MRVEAKQQDNGLWVAHPARTGFSSWESMELDDPTIDPFEEDED